MWCPIALCVKFQGCDVLGTHALPPAKLGEHVEEEVVEVCARSEIVQNLFLGKIKN
jgi:purine nucleoside phosphorylase